MDLRNNSWLSGFTDGDGCFTITKQKSGMSFSLLFTIGQRDDHSTALLLLYREFGGRLNWKESRIGTKNDKPQMSWVVSKKDDILGLIEYFDKYPPIVKEEQYLLWREAALCYYEGLTGRNRRSVPFRVIFKMEAYRTKLARLRKYNLDRAIGLADIDYVAQK